jgi:23S rRNA pseudouridine2605 synthase
MTYQSDNQELIDSTKTSNNDKNQAKSQKLAAFLAHGGVASRRRAEELILNKKVKVNGQVENNVARRVIPGQDVVEYQGKQITIQEEKVILAINKPPGVVSTVNDPDGKPTVMKYIPPQYQDLRLFPVGRLDELSEGLILLTNDGDLAYKLSHPKYQSPRTYQVNITGRLSSTELRRLQSGIPLKDGRTQGADVIVVDETNSGQILEITIKEGRHHQIRRMMQALNHEVLRLVRLSHGPYELGNLPSGQWRLEKSK